MGRGGPSQGLEAGVGSWRGWGGAGTGATSEPGGADASLRAGARPLKVQTRTGVCVSWIPRQHWRWGEAAREGQEAGGRPETSRTSHVRPGAGGDWGP